MPIQAPQWTEFLSCPVCCHEFDGDGRGPVTLGCGHSICRGCLTNLHRKQCPFDQSVILLDIGRVPLNGALVKLVGAEVRDEEVDKSLLPGNAAEHYASASACIQELALYLKPFSSGSVSVLSKPMQRKLVTLANCQLLAEEGRARAIRAARSLGERTVTELLLQHQNPLQLFANLWAAVRARGCQFLGPAMQEEVLKLVLLALEDGSRLSRKVLVMFVVQRLEPRYPQASKTSIGRVIQLLYRASCFKVSKREDESSLMQLKEEFRSCDALRREHDAQIVQIATEAGLRIAPDQWSALLYGDTAHKSHMQSIMDKLQTPQSFSQSVQELVMALQRSRDPGNLSHLRTHLELLAGIGPAPEAPTWEKTASVLEAARVVVVGLVDFVTQHGNRRQDGNHANRYKSREATLRGSARGPYGYYDPDGEKYRGRGRKPPPEGPSVNNVLPAILLAAAAPSSPSVSDLFPASAPTENILVAVPKPLRNGWFTPGEADREDYAPFEQALANKYGPICRQRVRRDDDDAVAAAAVSVSDPGALANARRFAAPPLINPHQPHHHHHHHQLLRHHHPQSYLISEQRELPSLEKKMLELKLGDRRPGNSLHDGCRDEELYEAGIAADMKELAQRWESELAEQERRWSES